MSDAPMPRMKVSAMIDMEACDAIARGQWSSKDLYAIWDRYCLFVTGQDRSIETTAWLMARLGPLIAGYVREREIRADVDIQLANLHMRMLDESE